MSSVSHRQSRFSVFGKQKSRTAELHRSADDSDTEVINTDNHVKHQRFARFGRIALHVISFLACAVIAYTVALFFALRAIPMLLVFVGEVSGVKPSMNLITLAGFWLLPVVFLTAVLLVFYIWLIRASFRVRRRLLTWASDHMSRTGENVATDTHKTERTPAAISHAPERA